MIVSKIDDTLYEIKRGKTAKSWWTASIRTGNWFIMTGQSLRSVNPDGATGKRIVKAVEQFIALRNA